MQKSMKQALPSTIQVNGAQLNTEILPVSAQRILADIILADDELARIAGRQRLVLLAKKQLQEMFEKEVSGLIPDQDLVKSEA